MILRFVRAFGNMSRSELAAFEERIRQEERLPPMPPAEPASGGRATGEAVFEFGGDESQSPR